MLESSKSAICRNTRFVRGLLVEALESDVPRGDNRDAFENLRLPRDEGEEGEDAVDEGDDLALELPLSGVDMMRISCCFDIPLLFPVLFPSDLGLSLKLREIFEYDICVVFSVNDVCRIIVGTMAYGAFRYLIMFEFFLTKVLNSGVKSVKCRSDSEDGMN